VHDESELLAEPGFGQRLRALDQGALGTVFDAYYPPLYRYIYHHVRHQMAAEDLAGEVFTRMIEQLAQGRGPQTHLRAWLYRVAHNLVIDQARQHVYRDHLPLEEWDAASSQNVVADVHHAIAWQQACTALDALTVEQRAVIILKYLEGWSNREVARVLDTTVGAVKALQHRGLASMRRHLERLGAIEGEAS
jgi:RNA polymerase sigma-70 factor (ECF subfamily)